MPRSTRLRCGWIAILGGLVLLAGLPRVEAAKPLRFPRERADWESERINIRQSITSSLGNLNPRPVPPTFKVVDRKELEGFPVERFEIATDAGARVRGVLVLPHQAASGDRVPAVIYLGDDPSLGAQEPLQPGPDGIPPAVALARRGIAVLCLDVPFNTHHRPADGHPYIPGTDGEGVNANRPIWGRILSNDLDSLDALLADPGIDPKRVGVVGHGLGGTRALWLMALDDRIACGVAANGLTRFTDLQAAAGPGDAPRTLALWARTMLKQYDTEALIALCAPRPFGILAGELDPATPPSAFTLFTKTAERAYTLYGQKGNFQKTFFGGLGREFTTLQWDMMVEQLDKHLLPQGPAPLGHAPEPEPVVDDRWINPAEKGLAGWVAEMSQRPTTWAWRDGTIVCAPGNNEYGWLRAPIEVEDFILQVEWKVPKEGNTGIFLRAHPVLWDIPPGPEAKPQLATLGPDWPSRTGLELQAQDDPGHADKYSSGSLYRHAAPAENPIKPAGQWNRYTVRCRGMRVEVWSNGKQVLDTTIDQFPMLRQPPLRGYFGLQNHGVGAEFRNLRLLRLEQGA
jgi:dienelactone hydrolase